MIVQAIALAPVEEPKLNCKTFISKSLYLLFDKCYEAVQLIGDFLCLCLAIDKLIFEFGNDVSEVFIFLAGTTCSTPSAASP